MAAKQQSLRQSKEFVAPSTPTRSLIVWGVPISAQESKVQQNLSNTYLEVEKVSRLCHKDGNPDSSIQVDFMSSKVAINILADKKILIGGKQYFVRGHWPLILDQNQKEEHKPSNRPATPLTDQRMMKLFRKQQAQLETLIRDFETRWNALLPAPAVPSVHVDVERLLPVFNNVTTAVHQFNEQTTQVHNTVAPVVRRIQEIQEKLNSQ